MIDTETQIKNVLIVEDDLSLRPFWEFVLQRHFKKFRLHWAVDSENARTIYLATLSNRDSFSLIVLDLFLSGSGTGIDFLDLLNHFEEPCPVLFVSTVNDEKLESELKDFQLWIEVCKKPLSVPRVEMVLDRADPLAFSRVGA